MRLFGKHIFRSIRSAPLQPIMIVIIFMLSAAVAVLSVCLPVNIYRNETESFEIDELSADILISLRATSEERLLFTEEITEHLGGRGRVVGEFSLSGFYSADGAGRELVDIGAFRLDEADAFYEIRYLEYGKFTNKNLDSSAIISASFAERCGISLGDEISVRVLGRDFSYTVEAIAYDCGIMLSREILVDISSVRAALGERSPLIASLSSEFDPYTKLHVKVNDGVDLDGLKNELESKQEFANTRIELAVESAKSGSISTILVLTIVMPALLLLIVAALMALSSYDLLVRKRLSDIALFKMVGAEKRHLDLLLYLESTVYGALGGVLGCVLYIPIMHWLNGVYDFKYSRMRFGILEVVLGVGFALIFAWICTALHIRRDGRASERGENFYTGVDTKSKPSAGMLLILKSKPSAGMLLILLPVILSATVTLILSPIERYVPALVLTFSLVILLYAFSPYLIGAFARVCEKLLSLGARCFGKLILAAKSLIASYPLRHAGRVVTLLTTVCISISVILSAAAAQLSDYLAYESFDLVGVNADDKTKDMLSGLDSVLAIAEVTMGRNMTFESGKTIYGVSIKGDVDSCFGGTMLPSELPEGDKIAVSSVTARMLGISLGDRVKCTVSGISCELTVSEIFAGRGDLIYYDASYVGTGYDTICISTDGSQEAREEITALFNERGAEIIEGEALFLASYQRIAPQLKVFVAMFLVMVFMTVVGIFNIFASQRRARSYEFGIMKQNGMTRGAVGALQTVELAYILVCAILISLPFSFLLCRAIDTAAVSFGITIFPNL